MEPSRGGVELCSGEEGALPLAPLAPTAAAAEDWTGVPMWKERVGVEEDEEEDDEPLRPVLPACKNPEVVGSSIDEAAGTANGGAAPAAAGPDDEEEEAEAEAEAILVSSPARLPREPRDARER
jgi:hypothetical protein